MSPAVNINMAICTAVSNSWTKHDNYSFFPRCQNVPSTHQPPFLRIGNNKRFKLIEQVLQLYRQRRMTIQECLRQIPQTYSGAMQEEPFAERNVFPPWSKATRGLMANWGLESKEETSKTVSMWRSLIFVLTWSFFDQLYTLWPYCGHIKKHWLFETSKWAKKGATNLWKPYPSEAYTSPLSAAA